LRIRERTRRKDYAKAYLIIRHRHIFELCSGVNKRARIEASSSGIRTAELARRERERARGGSGGVLRGVGRGARGAGRGEGTERRSAKVINLLLCSVAGRVVKKMQLCRNQTFENAVLARSFARLFFQST
jgi:hypothetical protein